MNHLLPRRREQVTVAFLLVGLFVVSLSGFQGKTNVRTDNETDQSYRFLVDPNRADSSEFRILPGIGEKLADGIIQYREENGPIRDHEELINIKGIGPKKLETLKLYLLENREDR